MVTKTSQAVKMFNQGLLKEALSLFKTFRIGFTKEEKRILEIASDCLNGRSSFYKQIGVDTEKAVSDSQLIIKAKYNL